MDSWSISRWNSLLATSLLLLLVNTATSDDQLQPFCSKISNGVLTCFNIKDFNYIQERLPTDNSIINTLSIRDSPELILSGDHFNQSTFQHLEIIELISNNLTRINSDVFEGLGKLNSFNAESNNITEISAGLFSGFQNVRYIYLTDNYISVIDKDAFRNMKQLLAVQLYDNYITSIPDTLFEGLSYLFSLDLSYNNLTALHDGNFKGLTALGILALSNNNITTISAGAFSGLTELYYVNLEDNQLQTLDPAVFESNNKLSLLDLSGNNLKNLENFPLNIPSLRILTMHNCQISSIPTKFFANLMGLFEINLGKNNFTTIEPAMFTILPKVNNIYLHDNRIMSLTVATFMELNAWNGTIVHWSGNPWDCSTSDMVAMRRYFDEEELEFGESFECAA